MFQRAMLKIGSKVEALTTATHAINLFPSKLVKLGVLHALLMGENPNYGCSVMKHTFLRCTFLRGIGSLLHDGITVHSLDATPTDNSDVIFGNLSTNKF